jgi:hypothetical protein
VLSDRIGSGIFELDEDGDFVRQVRFKPFGEMDQEHDPAPAQRQRVFGGIASNSYNAYSYARNNPASNIDPTGMFILYESPDPQDVEVITINSAQIPDLGPGTTMQRYQDEGFPGEGMAAAIQALSNASTGVPTSEERVVTATSPSQSDPSRGEALEANPADRAAILGAVDHARDMVEFNKQLPEPRGSALIRNADGKLERTAAEPYTLTKGKVNVGGIGWKQAPKNTAAIAGSSVLWARTGHVLKQASTFNGVSAYLGGIPVYVFAPYDQQIVVFEQGLEPRLWNP